MILFSAFKLAVAVLCVEIFVYFIVKKDKNFIEKAFCLVAGALSLNLLVTVLFVNSTDAGTASFLYRISYIPRSLFFIGASLVFNAFFYENFAIPRWFLRVLWLLGIPVMIGGLLGVWEVAEVVVDPAGTRAVQDRNSPMFYYFLCYMLFVFVDSMIMIGRTLFKKESKRLYLMSVYFLRLFAGVWFATLSSKYLIPLLVPPGAAFEPISGYFFAAFGVFGMFYAYKKYSFMQNSVPLTIGAVLEHIGEGVLYTDPAGFVRKSNPAAEKYLKKLPGKTVYELFPENDFESETASEVERVSGVMMQSAKKVIQVKLYFRKVFDRFGDFIGYLIVFSENNHLEELIRRFGLTVRELEIIRMLHDAHKSNYIAEKLFISPHTVRNHLQNIYLKTGVSNKAGLLKLLYRN